MPITFKSKATGDLIMLTAHAGALLGRIGKSVSGAGILTVPEMPAALKVLKNLDDGAQAEHSRAAADQAAQAANDEPVDIMDEPVTLRKRAVPLVRMIEEAHASSEPIVWGV
jgi:Domain of unknown function (DUF1840)